MWTEPATRSSPWRATAKELLLAGGYYGARLSRTTFPGVAVLCFHGLISGRRESVPFEELHVSPEVFAGQCELIARHCTPLSGDDLRRARQSGQPLPPRSVLVTFDDGYASVLSHALPVLARYRIPATVFVASEPIEREEHFWYDAMWRRHGEAAVLAARRAPYADWRRLVDSVRTPALQAEDHRPLTRDELKALAGHPLIEIGAHTLTHPTLARVPGSDQREEIASCRKRLAELTGTAVTSFAYPYGDPGIDFLPDTVSFIRDAGFDQAFTTVPTFAPAHGDRWQIPRFTMLESVTAAELAHRLSHSWHSSL
jgi:peptidoglycan/xylan/chitin deacetylase (PgdA/CDA1 family)